MPSPVALRELAERWAGAKPAERANFQSYLNELCGALGVEPPRPAGTGYQFEFPIRVVARDGTESTNFIDCYKSAHFALEAKDEETGRSSDLLLRKAFGQVRTYAGNVPDERPPYLIVLDVGKTALIWDRWHGDYGGFNAGRRLDLTRLADSEADAALLKDIFENPDARDPRAKAAAVTKEVAAHLANLASALEHQGLEQERVARFIMRCIFTMFAEDIGLLRDEPFRTVIGRAAGDPEVFTRHAADLWAAMDAGDDFLLRKLLRFNGHFFKDHEALPISREALLILQMAADADWQHVEPSIFGTLLTRALDPAERHRLGAQFTPREFVERVVRPTVEDPIRERWTAVQAEVLQHREAGKRKQAEEALRGFHEWLKGLRFLDPACGSGNFLYVTMHLVKRIELEAIRALEEVTGKHEMRLAEVGPWQFHGIEVKPWAREIAELTLWIGFHQFWKAHHDVQPPEPILQDTGTLECRDAVLTWDEIREAPDRARPDPMPRIRHPVTGELVPDPKLTLAYHEYVGARPAEWPKAEFIIGNPPYLGQARQRDEFGDGYVDALRAAYQEVPDTADYVMYWWYRAAEAVAGGGTLRAGLITTNTITQAQNRVVIGAAADRGARVVWAVPDHPWVEETGGAAVRVAMTVIAKNPAFALRVEVNDDATVLRETRALNLNDDLSAHADVPAVAQVPLASNEGLCNTGFKLHGAGFILTAAEAATLQEADARNREVIRPYRHGRDLAARPRGVSVMDFANRTEAEAREYPLLFDLVRDRVKPDRDANRDASRRTYWWRFGRSNAELRSGVAGLARYIATPETARHRFFVFLDQAVAPDNMLVCTASADGFHLGVLSSSIHGAWALSSGGRLGVGNDPRYNKTLCFDPFPFPDPPAPLRVRIAAKAEQLDAHRRAALDRDRQVTMTGMYNIVEKLRSGRALTKGDQEIHAIAACGVLKDLHDELDTLVAQAYGWEWPLPNDIILERLVALHDERVREEKAGKVRWLRPEYQVPRFGKGLQAPAPALGLPEAAREVKLAPKPRWPSTVVEQITAIKKALAAKALTAEELASAFAGARTDIVRRHLDILDVMGEVQSEADGRYHATIAGSVAVP
jgi:hypothetical protein